MVPRLGGVANLQSSPPPSTIPRQNLGKYVDYKNKKVSYMNTVECEIYMREVAKIATGILDDKILQKLFGVLSFRVTACNKLARLRVEDSFIKRRLRWSRT